MPQNRLEINVNDAVTVSAPKDLMAAGLDRPNRIAQLLRGGRFFWTIEFVAASAPVPREDLVIIDAFVRELAARPEIAGFSVTDRVHSDQDPDPTVGSGNWAAMRSYIKVRASCRLFPMRQVNVESTGNWMLGELEEIKIVLDTLRIGMQYYGLRCGAHLENSGGESWGPKGNNINLASSIAEALWTGRNSFRTTLIMACPSKR